MIGRPATPRALRLIPRMGLSSREPLLPTRMPPALRPPPSVPPAATWGCWMAQFPGKTSSRCKSIAALSNGATAVVGRCGKEPPYGFPARFVSLRRPWDRTALDAQRQRRHRHGLSYQLPCLVHPQPWHRQRNLLSERRLSQYTRSAAPDYRRRNFLSRGKAGSRTRNRIPGKEHSLLSYHKQRPWRTLSNYQRHHH